MQFDQWINNYSSINALIKHLTGIVGKALPQAATPENMSGFRCTVICPYNFEIFSEDDFASAFVTNRPELTTAFVSTADPSEPTPGPSVPTPAFSPVEVMPFPKAGPECCQGKEEDGKCHPQRHSSQTGYRKKAREEKRQKTGTQGKKRKDLEFKEKEK